MSKITVIGHVVQVIYEVNATFELGPQFREVNAAGAVLLIKDVSIFNLALDKETYPSLKTVVTVNCKSFIHISNLKKIIEISILYKVQNLFYLLK